MFEQVVSAPRWTIVRFVLSREGRKSRIPVTKGQEVQV